MDIPDELITGSKRILLLWHGANKTETIQEVVENLRLRTGENGVVLLEHVERLLVGKCHFMRINGLSKSHALLYSCPRDIFL